MSKINLLPIILIITFLSACGFHTPQQSSAFNASIISSASNAFAGELEKHFDQTKARSLVIQIGDEVQQEQSASFDRSGEVQSYSLSLNVPVKVFDNNKKLLLAVTLTNSTYLTAQTLQADRLQISESAQQLRNTLVTRLLRRLKRLKP